MSSLVYQITNTITNQKYVGWTTKSTEERFKVHKQCANRGDSSYLYNSMRKHGNDNFVIETLERGDDDTYMLKEREPYYISKLSEEERLNITDGGYGGVTSTSFKKGIVPWSKGKKMPKEVGDKISKARTQYWIKWREEHPNYKDKWQSRKRATPERKAEIAEMYSKKVTELNKVKVECPHCSKTGNVGNMKRWHFDNCKSI
jgi:group I intron endonuclease